MNKPTFLFCVGLFCHALAYATFGGFYCGQTKISTTTSQKIEENVLLKNALTACQTQLIKGIPGHEKIKKGKRR